jgi:hypothetical protein
MIARPGVENEEVNSTRQAGQGARKIALFVARQNDRSD